MKLTQILYYLIINGTLKLSTYTILVEYEIFELFILNNEKGNKYLKTYYCYLNIISKKKRSSRIIL